MTQLLWNIRNTDVGKVMMAFILATDFDFIAYMSKMAFFWGGGGGSFFHANGIFGIWSTLQRPVNRVGLDI